MQDFSQRFSIVVNKQNEPWQSMNTVAHISAYLGNKLTTTFDTGEFFTTSDGAQYPRNSQFPIIVLSGKPGQLKNLYTKVSEAQLLSIGFIREMIETTDDAQIEALLAQKKSEDLELLGVGVFGSNERIQALTKGFSLWK